MTVIYETPPATALDSARKVLQDPHYRDATGAPFEIKSPPLKRYGLGGKDVSIQSMEKQREGTWEYLVSGNDCHRHLWMSGRKQLRMTMMTGPFRKFPGNRPGLFQRVNIRLQRIIAQENSHSQPVIIRLIDIPPVFMRAIWIVRGNENKFWLFRQIFECEFRPPIPEQEMSEADFLRIVEGHLEANRKAWANVPMPKRRLRDYVRMGFRSVLRRINRLMRRLDARR